MPAALEMIGKRFSKLKVVKRVKNSKSARLWLCQCSCGGTTITSTGNLRNGHTKSCGCLHLESIVKHGEYQTTFYKTWIKINQRCTNPKAKSFDQYGGRGIRVEWKSYEDFRRDMLPSYKRHLKRHAGDTSIERKDVNGNYSKGNCRWATDKEQGRNMQKTVFATFKGKRLDLSTLSERTGVPKARLYHRVSRLGWSGDKAVSVPVRNGGDLEAWLEMTK